MKTKFRFRLRQITYPTDKRWWVSLALGCALVLWSCYSINAFTEPLSPDPAVAAGRVTGMILYILVLSLALADDFFSFSRWVGRGLRRLTKDVTEAEEGRLPQEPAK